MTGLQIFLLIFGIVTVFVIIPIIIIVVLISKSNGGACYNSVLGGGSCVTSSKKDCKGTYFDSFDACKKYMDSNPNSGSCYTDDGKGSYGCETSSVNDCHKQKGTYYETDTQCLQHMKQLHPESVKL